MTTLSSVASGLDEKPPSSSLASRESRFNITYNSPDGVKKDVVTSRILDGDERIQVARLSANLARPIAFDNLPTNQQARVWAISWVSRQLRDIPKWLDRWIMEDDTLLFQIYQACQEHDQLFFRSGGGEGQEDQETPRVFIDTEHSTAATPK